MFGQVFPIQGGFWFKLVERNQFGGIEQVEVLDKGRIRNILKQTFKDKLRAICGRLHVQAFEELQNAAIQQPQPRLEQITTDDLAYHIASIVKTFGGDQDALCDGERAEVHFLRQC